jgi:hypothetical protein
MCRIVHLQSHAEMTDSQTICKKDARAPGIEPGSRECCRLTVSNSATILCPIVVFRFGKEYLANYSAYSVTIARA